MLARINRACTGPCPAPSPNPIVNSSRAPGQGVNAASRGASRANRARTVVVPTIENGSAQAIQRVSVTISPSRFRMRRPSNPEVARSSRAGCTSEGIFFGLGPRPPQEIQRDQHTNRRGPVRVTRPRPANPAVVGSCAKFLRHCCHRPIVSASGDNREGSRCWTSSTRAARHWSAPSAPF